MKTTATLLLALAMACQLHAQMIDFETLPTGSLPTEGMVISNQFLTSHGVSFAFTDGTFPHVAIRDGIKTVAFWGPPNHTIKNRPATNQNVGNFFLTDDGLVGGAGGGGVPAPFIITYATPVTAASGVILDVDKTDAWLIEARNSQTQVVAFVRLDNTVATPNRGDGKACPWTFNNISIGSIAITYVGNEGSPGLAFDNFSPALPVSPASVSDLSANTQGMAVKINANFGQAIRVEFADSFPPTNWLTLTNIFLTNAPTQQVIDPSWTNAPRRFYRAVALP